MALPASQLPSLSSGMTSGFTVDYRDPSYIKTWDYETYNWTPVQNIINKGYDIWNLPEVVKINFNILRTAVRMKKITIPQFNRETGTQINNT